VVDCQASAQDCHRGFIFQSGEGQASVLDGFTITHGFVYDDAWYSIARKGGGIATCMGTSPTIRNNVLTGNEAVEGGGIYCCGTPTITGNTITNNTAVDGGGINCYERGTIAGNTIAGNSARRGGGIFTWEDFEPTIACNIIRDNWAEVEGGGIGSHDNSPAILNNLIVGNATAGSGGGIYLQSAWSLVRNNTICSNVAARGGGLASRVWDVPPHVVNCILWANVADVGPELAIVHDLPYGQDPTVLKVTYCDVAGGQAAVDLGSNGVLQWGEGNLDVDPRFTDAQAGNYRLRPGSRCINAGDPEFVPEPGETDLDGDPRVRGWRVDMGAYEASPKDLVAALLQTPPRVRPGESLPLQWHVDDLYPEFTTGIDWRDGVYLSADDRLDASDTPLATLPAAPLGTFALEGGYDQAATSLVPAGAQPPGTWFLILKTDSDEAISEVDEINNLLVQPVMVLWSGPPGDVNNDGCVNVSDLVRVRASLGQEGSAIVEPRVDVDCNGVVNVSDLVAVRLGLGNGCE
jgi:hypothetical protein